MHVCRVAELWMDKQTLTSCPLCGGTQLQRALTCIDHYASGEVFHLCRCASCGFLFTEDSPPEDEIGRYYDTPDYISHSDTRKGLVNRLYHRARHYMLKRKARLVERESHRTTGSLLDIGTGTGYFADTMKQRGWQVQAVEKSEQARRFASEHFGLQVLPHTGLDKLPAAAFDVITLWHVLEHLEHLDKTWERLYDLLADKGVLVVAVPNCSSYDARKYGAYWAAYDVPRHLWHFTPSTMQQWASRHGFIMAARYAMPLDAFYVSILSERYMHRSFPFLRGMLTGIAAWFSALVRKERSSSMIYVFRKKKKERSV